MFDSSFRYGDSSFRRFVMSFRRFVKAFRRFGTPISEVDSANSPISYSRPHWGELRKTHQSEANAGKK